GAVYAVHGDVDQPWVIFQGTLTTSKGQIVSASVFGVAEDRGTPRAQAHTSPSALFREIGLGPETIGTPVESPEQHQALLRAAVPVAREHMEQQIAPQQIDAAHHRVE